MMRKKKKLNTCLQHVSSSLYLAGKAPVPPLAPVPPPAPVPAPPPPPVPPPVSLPPPVPPLQHSPMRSTFPRVFVP